MVDSITLNTDHPVGPSGGELYQQPREVSILSTVVQSSLFAGSLYSLGVLRYSELVRNMAGHGGLPPSLQQHYASGDGLLGVTATATVFSTNSFRPPATLSANVFSLRYVSVQHSNKVGHNELLFSRKWRYRLKVSHILPAGAKFPLSRANQIAALNCRLQAVTCGSTEHPPAFELAPKQLLRNFDTQNQLP